MTQPLFEPTWKVSDLCGEIRGVLGEVFSSLWVVGEVQRVRESRRGHVYFELVEKDDGDTVCGKLDAVLWRTDWSRVRRALRASGQELAEGVEIRCQAKLDFWGPGGRLQLVVREIDPNFTLGLLERRRRETLAALTAAGLLEVNRGLPLADLPLEIALVTSEGSAAYHDFLSTLRESGYGFRVTLVHASVQGARAERELVSALAAATVAGPGGRSAACVVLIRGGGSRSDLAVFDSRAVAEAVARSPLPVLTGLGHEIDEAIADKVAHTALKTPTKVAELLVERVARAERATDDASRALRHAALGRLRDGREALGRSERGVELARTRLQAAAARLDDYARALARAALDTIRSASRVASSDTGRLSRAAKSCFVQSKEQVSGVRDRIRSAGRRSSNREVVEVATVAHSLARLGRVLIRQQARILAETSSRVGRSARRTVSDSTNLVHNASRKLRMGAKEFCIRDSRQLRQAARQLSKAGNQEVKSARLRLAPLFGRCRGIPRVIRPLTSEVERERQRLVFVARERLQKASIQLSQHQASSRQLDPRRVLERGYSITKVLAKVVRSSSDVNKGQEVTTQTADGQFQSRVTEAINE